MSFEEPNDPRSSEIGNNQIQLTELAMYEEQTLALLQLMQDFKAKLFPSVYACEPGKNTYRYSFTSTSLRNVFFYLVISTHDLDITK